MIDFLVSILEANINFQTLGAFLILYFASIWFLFCLWVFIDAKRRFEKTSIAIAFFIIVFVFNFPGLIFYLIIRPDKNEDHYLYLQNNEIVSEQESKGGVDVPIINFIGENGEVNLSFQLRINKGLTVNNLVPNIEGISNDVMQVNVGIPNTKVVEPQVTPAIVETETKSVESNINPVTGEESKKGVKMSFSTVKSKIFPRFNTIRANFTKKAQPLNIVEVDIQNSNPLDSKKENSNQNSTNAKIRNAFQRSKKGNNKKKKKRR